MFYDGESDWTAATSLHERVFLSDALGSYIPDYRCILMQLKDYSNAELMERRNELSVLLMITKLHHSSEFFNLEREVRPEELEKIFADTPEYLLGIVAHIVETLLDKINVPAEGRVICEF